ncbi:unnamed protein product, partial [Ectocarpus sp. 4 AP-2014]
ADNYSAEPLRQQQSGGAGKSLIGGVGRAPVVGVGPSDSGNGLGGDSIAELFRGGGCIRDSPVGLGGDASSLLPGSGSRVPVEEDEGVGVGGKTGGGVMVSVDSDDYDGQGR